jgi:hypothetical protein
MNGLRFQQDGGEPGKVVHGHRRCGEVRPNRHHRAIPRATCLRTCAIRSRLPGALLTNNGLGCGDSSIATVGFRPAMRGRALAALAPMKTIWRSCRDTQPFAIKL